MLLRYILAGAVVLYGLGASGAHAQNLRGTVQTTDAQPIPLASVNVLNNAAGTAANDDGQFALTLPDGTYELQVSAIGFATRVVTATTGNQTVVITLETANAALSEVVVTAQRTEASLVTTPVAVTTLSARELDETQTWDLADLTARVPTYLYQELGVAFQQLQSIRGIQVFSEVPAVATYVDGVNGIDILANGFPLVDVERVEVLRGPQGTLFGRNALGGVVNIITKTPTNRTDAFAEISAGELGLQRYAAGIRSPLVENKLFAGFTGLYQQRGGYLENDTTGTFFGRPEANGVTIGQEDTFYGNLSLQWLPSTRFSARLNVKAQRDASDASGFFISVGDEVTARANPDNVFISRVGTHERNVLNTALALDYYGDGYTLSSVTTAQRIGLGYENIDSGGSAFSSYDGETVGAIGDPQVVYSQEFRIASAGQGPLSYTAGLYGFTQNAFEPTTNLAFESGPNTFAIFRNDGTNTGIAAFGQGTYAVTPQLDITAGLRFDSEEREATFNGFGDLVLMDGQETEFRPDTTVSGSYQALSPKVALTYHLNDDASAYASYTRGFRAGGINAQRLPDGFSQTYDPEYSDNLEVGVKANLLENRLFVAGTAFLINWTDLQFFNEVAVFTFQRDNLGDAQSRGVELEVSVLPVENLRVDANFSLLDTEYEDFAYTRFDFFTGNATVTQIGGNRLANAPGHTGFLGAQYTLPISDGLAVVARGEVRRVGPFYSDVQNTLRQDAYTTFNARLGVTTPQFEAYLWAQNLTDERYLIYGAPDTATGNRSSLIAPPRQLGVTLTARY